MGLANWFSGWGRAFREQTDYSVDRANVRFILPHDTARYSAPTSRRAIREKYEWLWQNFGLVRELVAGIARHVVGKGISPQLNTTDLEWNAEADAQFEEWALTPDRCDIAGRRNFYEGQTFAVEQYIGPGEFFASDVGNPRWNGEPCFQLYDPSEICTPPDLAEDPRVLDGVRIDENYVPTDLYLRVQGDKDFKYEPRPASGFTHWFSGHTANQVRGISPFAAALNNLVDVHELKRLTTKTAKAQQLIALVLKGVDKKRGRGAFGAIKNSGASTAGYDASQDNAQLEQLFTGSGAGIAYLNDDGSAELLSSNSPSPLVEPFVTDVLLRDVSLAPGVPLEFFWAPQKITSANQRFILTKADLFFQMLGDALIYRWIRRSVIRVLSWRMQAGLLRTPSDPQWMMKLSFQTPARLSIDIGRDGALQINRLGQGLTTLRNEYDKEGKGYRPEMRQWIREILEFLEIAKQEKAPPELIAKWTAALPVWRAHATGAGVSQSSQPPNDNQTEDQAA
jgi:capsid protein